MKKVRRVFAKDLSEKEQEAFAREFYLRDEAPDDWDTPAPLGCPWYFGYPVELRGDTIDEMVDDYIRKYCDDFTEEE